MLINIDGTLNIIHCNCRTPKKNQRATSADDLSLVVIAFA